jgi:hypothetical protein
MNGTLVFPPVNHGTLGTMVYETIPPAATTTTAGGRIRDFPNTRLRVFPNDVGRDFPTT